MRPTPDRQGPSEQPAWTQNSVDRAITRPRVGHAAAVILPRGVAWTVENAVAAVASTDVLQAVACLATGVGKRAVRGAVTGSTTLTHRRTGGDLTGERTAAIEIAQTGSVLVLNAIVLARVGDATAVDADVVVHAGLWVAPASAGDAGLTEIARTTAPGGLAAGAVRVPEEVEEPVTPPELAAPKSPPLVVP